MEKVVYFYYLYEQHNTTFTANLCDLRKSISLEIENSLVLMEEEKLHTVSIPI